MLVLQLESGSVIFVCNINLMVHTNIAEPISSWRTIKINIMIMIVFMIDNIIIIYVIIITANGFDSIIVKFQCLSRKILSICKVVPVRQ